MTVNDAVARRVIKLMNKRKMTQYRLEKESGLTHGAVSGILCGINKTVKLDTIYKLAKAFDMTLIEFLDDELFSTNNVSFEG